jgi:hypothetical protein
MKKIKKIFVVCLVFNLVLTVLNIEFYPTIKFPHFYCRNFREDIKFLKVELKDENNKKINLSTHVRPYDKRFVLFGLRSLIDSTSRKRAHFFFNRKSRLSKKIIKVEVSEVVIKLPE